MVLVYTLRIFKKRTLPTPETPHISVRAAVVGVAFTVFLFLATVGCLQVKSLFLSNFGNLEKQFTTVVKQTCKARGTALTKEQQTVNMFT